MNEDNNDVDDKLKQLKIETPVPSKAAGIESVKESFGETMSPHRLIFRWFARRPTTTTRLAILSSILPPSVSDDELLKLMGVGPRTEIEGSIEEYVLSKQATKSEREGSVEDHFGYPYTHKTLPSSSEMEELHNELKEYWGGELPTVVDPTAGGATIPFESLRYGLPTIANELNPVAWLLNKVILEYPPEQGDITSDVEEWANKINKRAKDSLSEYFPDKGGIEPDYYFRTYTISCPSCGGELPLSGKWWFNKDNDKDVGHAIKPEYENGRVSYRTVEVTESDEFDPSQGTVDGGDAECPHCGVVTERDDVVTLFDQGEFEYEICAIKFTQEVNGAKYHPPTDEDFAALEAAEEKIESDLELSTLLREDRYIGYYDRAAPYGITQWRDLFTPRQLLAHATYLNTFDELKPEIRDRYDEKKAEAILVLLTLIGTRQINHNSRLTPIRATRGYVNDMLGNNNFSFKWDFGENNMLTGGKSYNNWKQNVLENYKKVVNYYPDESKDNPPSLQIHQGDAADLPIGDDSIEAIIIDPPYGDNIIYSEVADAFYVWQRKYLNDVFPDKFTDTETEKDKEAVENPALNDNSAGSSAVSARDRYEERMRDIFTDSYRILEPGGVITIYFTDKEIGAWDSLTMSIMEAGFTITATHTISSETPSRIGVQGQSSADTSLLLTCRKPLTPEEDNQFPTLWSDIRDKTREAATSKATELLDSGLNLTKTDVIIGAFGPTLRVFTEEYPVVDKHDNQVRPKQALEEARAAVTEVLIERELEDKLDDVDALTRWYILSWLVYENETIPYDEARQLGIGVGVQIDEIKQNTKIWSKSRDKLVLRGQDYRVRDFTALEAGEKRRQRGYPVDPRDESFDNNIDAVHAALNVLETKGGDFTWNWVKNRDLQNSSWFRRTLKSLIQVLPESHQDYALLVNLASGETGELLDIELDLSDNDSEKNQEKTTLGDFSN